MSSLTDVVLLSIGIYFIIREVCRARARGKLQSVYLCAESITASTFSVLAITFNTIVALAN